MSKEELMYYKPIESIDEKSCEVVTSTCISRDYVPINIQGVTFWGTLPILYQSSHQSSHLLYLHICIQ